MKKYCWKTASVLLASAVLCAGFSGCEPGVHTPAVRPVEFSFYAVNDLHGKFMDTDNQPGLDEFTTYFKKLYKDPSKEEILLSSGDMWQGTVESSSNRGRLMTEWMNTVGFASMTLGNHEFDWGAEALEYNSGIAEFPLLAINVTYNGAPAAYCSPSVVVEKSGVKFGIIGAIGDCLSSISGEFQSGLHFAAGSELTALVKQESTRLRTEEGCDFIVYSLHEGFDDTYASKDIHDVKQAQIPYYDVSLSDGFVDLVFEAHTHQRYILRDEYGVYHLQGGGENAAISCADVSYNTETKEFTVSPKIVTNSTYGDEKIYDDPSVEELYGKYFPDSDPYKTVLGENAFKWDAGDIADKVAELYYKIGVEVWGDRYEIALGGGYLKTRNPYNLAKGKVTYADLFSLFPFDNAVVLGSIKGKDLKSNFLSVKQNYHTYCGSQLNAGMIDDNETYYIVVDSYTSTYRQNHITEVARLDGKIYARDLLSDYIADGRRA